MKELGFDVRKAESSFKLSRKFLPQMLKGGFSALIGQKPPLENYNCDVSNYDTVCIGSPIWNGRLASPVNTILEKTDLIGKKVIFILYSGRGFAKKAEEKIKKLYPDSAVINLAQPKDDPERLLILEKI
jgi:menaquinone-dependent protoporphyrinogen IX oxidase